MPKIVKGVLTGSHDGEKLTADGFPVTWSAAGNCWHPTEAEGYSETYCPDCDADPCTCPEE